MKRHPEGLDRMYVESFFLDGEGPVLSKDAWGNKLDVPTSVEELERKIAPDDQSSAGFLD